MFQEILSQHFRNVEVKAFRIVGIALIDCDEVEVGRFEALAVGCETGEI